MTSPSPAETPRERLARLLDERRADLGLHWIEVAELAGLTREGLRKIRNGTRLIQTESKLGLERALRLKRGSINEAMAGGDLTPVDAEPEPAPKPEEDPQQLLRQGMELIARAEEIMRRQGEAS
ncbi:MAG: helix-turn-helix domain-containing protein [Actinomadura sp.]